MDHAILSSAGNVSDIVGFTSLALLAGMLGLLPLSVVGNVFLRIRYEIALIFAVAAVGRLLHYFDLDAAHEAQRIVQGVITALTAIMAVLRLAKGRRHGR